MVLGPLLLESHAFLEHQCANHILLRVRAAVNVTFVEFSFSKA